jgi:hypothetical protein
MKPSTALVALASFAAGAALALTAPEGLARANHPAKPSYYTDGRYGYSMLPPSFAKAEKDTAAMTATFFAPARNGFAANLGVMVQAVTMTPDQYRELVAGQLKQSGRTVLSETRRKVGGREAIQWEYEGALQGRELRWIELAVVDADRIFQLTGTAPKAEYDQVAAEFKACLDSFTLGD